MGASRWGWRACCLRDPQYEVLHDDEADSRPHRLLQRGTVVPTPVLHSQRSQAQHGLEEGKQSQLCAHALAMDERFTTARSKEAIRNEPGLLGCNESSTHAPDAAQCTCAGQGDSKLCRSSSDVERSVARSRAVASTSTDDRSEVCAAALAPDQQGAGALSQTSSLKQPSASDSWQKEAQGSAKDASSRISVRDMHALLANAGVHLVQPVQMAGDVPDGTHTYLGAARLQPCCFERRRCHCEHMLRAGTLSPLLSIH